jgi:hypothetical protein
MRGEAARIVLWLAMSLMVALLLGQIYLDVSNSAVDVAGAIVAAGFTLLSGLVGLGFVALGLIVVHRRPGNPVGWIITVTGITASVADFVESYAVYTLSTHPGSLPGGSVMAWLSAWIYIPVLFAAPAVLFLVFPDGSLLSRRWRPVFWLVILTTLATITTSAFQPVLSDPPFEGVVNPLDFSPPRALLEPLSYVGWPGMAASFLVAAVAMILRLRRAWGVERQQLKWLAAAAAVLPLASTSGVLLYYLGYDSIAGFLTFSPIVLIFLAAGYAILRYRLYDIDFIINRALVYGPLTAVLLTAYFGGVAITQVVFRTLTGQEQPSQFAVVLSTLAIATMFNPLRRRVQASIDRLFYRKRYDATKALEGFSTMLRDQTDLDELNDGIVTLISDTMQPEHVSLWLRPGESKAGP